MITCIRRYLIVSLFSSVPLFAQIGPAGSSTELQYRNSGAFGAVTGSSWDGTTLGLPQYSMNAINPSVGNDPTNRRMIDLSCTTDSTTTSPGFTNEACVQLMLTATAGQNVYGGGTNAKRTFLPLSIGGTYPGGGQHFALGQTVTCYDGTGDCGIHGNDYVQFAGGEIQGNEGKGWGLISVLTQQDHLSRYSVSSVPAPTACSTTLTQDVTASRTAQSVTVSSNTGCNVNDWVIVQQQVASGQPNLEAVKITGVSAGHVAGVFQNNHFNTNTVTPPTLLVLSSTFEIGENRVLVDLTGSSYITGMISGITAATFAGTGTTWTTGMVGGTSTNIGCITLTADNYIDAPFSNPLLPLRSWYQITGVDSTTSLTIHHYSDAGDTSYKGMGFGSGGYTIRPCARVLKIDGSTLVLESSSFAWTAGDTIEEIISPFPDLTGFEYHIAAYTNGGTYRYFEDIQNVGSRTIDTGVSIRAPNMRTGPTADTLGFNNGVVISNSGRGVQITAPTTTGVYIAGANVAPLAYYSQLSGIGYRSEMDQIGIQVRAPTVAGIMIESNIPSLGTLKFCTLSDTNCGTITPAAFGANRVLMLPDATGTIPVYATNISTTIACWRSDGRLGVATMSRGNITACS